jgi:hypothetical protein
MFVDTVPAISSREGQLIKAIVQVRLYGSHPRLLSGADNPECLKVG